MSTNENVRSLDFCSLRWVSQSERHFNSTYDKLRKVCQKEPNIEFSINTEGRAFWSNNADPHMELNAEEFNHLMETISLLM